MPASIGLIGARGDGQIRRLVEAIEHRGGSPLPFDLTDIPKHVAFHWQGEDMRFGEVELATLDAVYARTAHFPMPTFVPGAPKDQWEAMTFPIRESGSLMNAVVSELAARMLVINPPSAHRFHRQKPHLYATLQRAGVPVPPFAVGSDLAAAAHFVDAHGQQVLIKPLMGGEVFLANLAFLKEHHAQLDERPFLLQRRILGRSLRAYVVGDREVAAAEIVHGDVVDWRTDTQEIRPVSLGSDAAKAACRAVASQGLVFGAVDLEEDDEAPWVIDVNPAPMFAGFEARSGLDVAGPLAERLMAGDHSSQAPPTETTKSTATGT
ncbi:MAG: ATP-grasp domain-containing protein [Myxococcota bacterium]